LIGEGKNQESVPRNFLASCFLPLISKGQTYDTKLHSKADRGDDEESTSRSMTRRQQRYAHEGDLV